MKKFKSSIVIMMLICAWTNAEALDIEYATVLSTKSSNMIVQYANIGTKKNFLCSTSTLKCEPTKKLTLGVSSAKTLKKSLRQELEEKRGNHITISPSGNWLAYYIAGTDANPRRVFAIRNLKTDEESSISDSVSYWDLVNDQAKVFDFSPDSKSLAYIDDKDGTLAIYIADTTKLAGNEITSTKLAISAYQADDFIWTDQSTIYYIGNTKENPYLWSLYRYNLKTNKDTVIESNVSYVDPIRKVGTSLVFSRLQEKGYGIEAYNLSKKKIEQFKVPGISTKKKIANQEIINPGQAKAILLTPTKEDPSKTYPVVIWLHGGPYRQSGYGYHPYHSYGIYDSILELLRKNDVVVMKLDYRGSFGFGRSYAEGIKGSVGKGDVEDVMDAILYAKNRYHTSSIYLMGNSYGGYLSLRALVEHPTVFKGVVSINGVTDWQSLLEKIKTSIFNTEFGGLPDIKNQALYDQASIAKNIGKIGNQKISIIAGEADRTIPLWQATTFFDDLKKAGKDAALITYPGEDHVYAEKKTIASLCRELFTFIDMPIDPECSK